MCILTLNWGKHTLIKLFILLCPMVNKSRKTPFPWWFIGLRLMSPGAVPQNRVLGWPCLMCEAGGPRALVAVLKAAICRHDRTWAASSLLFYIPWYPTSPLVPLLFVPLPWNVPLPLSTFHATTEPASITWASYQNSFLPEKTLDFTEIAPLNVAWLVQFFLCRVTFLWENRLRLPAIGDHDISNVKIVIEYNGNSLIPRNSCRLWQIRWKGHVVWHIMVLCKDVWQSVTLKTARVQNLDKFLTLFFAFMLLSLWHRPSFQWGHDLANRSFS